MSCSVGDIEAVRIDMALKLDVMSPLGMEIPMQLDAELALTPPPEIESPSTSELLRNALSRVLQEIASEDEASAFLREICQETLARQPRRVCVIPTTPDDPGGDGNGSGWSDLDGSRPLGVGDAVMVSPPKSPQERLKALVPAAIEKSKSRGNRRGETRKMTTDVPRWRRSPEEDTTAPITDLAVMFTGDSVPDGFTKIERSPSGHRADLNKGGGGVFIYLCVSRDRSSPKLPISEILVIYPERGEFVPTDYEVVQRRGVPANVNTGTQGERVYLCVKRSSNSAISDIAVLFPRKGDKPPYGYLKLDKSPDGHVADLNAVTGGTEVVLCYRKRFQCLQGLQRHWLGQLDDVGAVVTPVKPPLGNNTAPKEPVKPQILDKADELRDTGVVTPPPSPVATPSPTSGLGSQAMSEAQHALAFYVFPLLLACYTRHGAAAETAVQALTKCVDSGVFDEDTPLCRLDFIVEAVASVCHQGVKSRFAVILPLLRKIIRKSTTTGFNPMVLHATLKTLTFIGDYDSSLVKSVEDELVYKIMSRYEAECTERQLATDRRHRFESIRTVGARDIAESIVNHLVDEVTDGVEIATTTEALLGVFKTHPSIHSPQFCSELVTALNVTFGSLAEKNVYQLLITLTKSVSRRSHVGGAVGNGASLLESGGGGGLGGSGASGLEDHVPVSMMNALRALNVTLVAAGPCTREHRAFGQVIRRLVFSAANGVAVLWSRAAYRASLALLSTLWNHYRRHLKVEFALLFEHMFLRILRSTSAGAVGHQLEIMDEITPWMQLPHNVVEIFLNFDMDRVQQWKIFEHLCAALCSIAEGSNAPTTATLAAASSAMASPPSGAPGPGFMGSGGDDVAGEQQLQIRAITMILAIARSVMDASGHAHLINRDARTRHLSMEHGGWEQDDYLSADVGATTTEAAPTSPVTPESLPTDSSDASTSPRAAGSPQQGSSSRNSTLKYATMSVRMRNELQKKNQQLLKRAMEIASAKSLKKAIEYLVAMNFVKETPRDISSFLRIYHDFFDETEIGDYLGEGDEDLKVQVRLTYVRAISFKGMTLVESLRHFLTNGGFRLPGEAQKIERMVEAFAQCYWEDAPTAFSTADTAMIIAYSIIMLNTDLHNPQVKKNKMSREQFVKNNRGIDNGRDLPRKFLEEIYDDIAHHPMHLKGSRFVPKSRESTALSLLDLDVDKFRSSVVRSVSQCDELMKDLSPSYFTFHFVGVDTCISPDLIKLLFERVWFYLLALSTSILCDTQSDLSLTMHCLDLLRFSISTCLFLGMSVERRAFCNLLVKVEAALLQENKSTMATSSTATTETETERDTDDETTSGMADGGTPVEWLEGIEAAAATDDPWRVMGDLHLLVNKLKDSIQRRQRSEELNSVIRRINRGAYYLKDTSLFIREGDLTKKCRSRNQTYRFFLFNDQLLYCDKGLSGYWNPHNSLRLKLTRLSDVPESVLHKHAFQISNPVKSFIVFADSAHAKSEWMRLIDDAIQEATKKISLNARRLSHRTTPRQSSAGSLGPLPVVSETAATTSAPTTTMTTLAPPASPTSLAASAMKTLMRRSTRLSSPSSDRDSELSRGEGSPRIRTITSPLVVAAGDDLATNNVEAPAATMHQGDDDEEDATPIPTTEHSGEDDVRPDDATPPVTSSDEPDDPVDDKDAVPP